MMIDRHQGLVAIGRAKKADAVGMKILRHALRQLDWRRGRIAELQHVKPVAHIGRSFRRAAVGGGDDDRVMRGIDFEILGALKTYKGAVVMVSHDEGAVEALNPERVVLLPDGVEDLWSADYLDLITLACARGG